MRLQISLEEACAEAARPGQVLLCHRGTLDPLAYWLRNGWDEAEFFALTELTRNEHLRRYEAVIHLETAAIGADAHYQRWPEAYRPETAEQVARVHRLCPAAWYGHPQYLSIENLGLGWEEKARVARGAIEPLLTHSRAVAGGR